VRDRRLEISGRRQTLGENRNFLRMERSYGPFRRTFDLGAPVDVDAISAAFETGVLRVLVPKRQAGGVQVEIAEEAG
jgi:HSP20 family protein